MLAPNGDFQDFPMAAIFVALDESESPLEEYPAVAVGGFIASGLQWIKFARDWNAVLEPDGIDVFHSADLETEVGRKGTIYEGWDAPRRQALQQGLLKAINSNLYRDVGVGLTRNAYDQVMTGDRPERLGDIYFFAAFLTMLDTIAYSYYHFGVAPSFIVEKGGPHVKKLHAAYDRLCKYAPFAEILRDTVFSEEPKSKKFPQLQAADYLVFNASKGISHLRDFKINPANLPRVHEGKEIRALRFPIQQIFKSFGSLKFAKIDKEKLEELVDSIEKAQAEMETE
jgi:hypothetical protein